MAAKNSRVKCPWSTFNDLAIKLRNEKNVRFAWMDLSSNMHLRWKNIFEDIDVPKLNGYSFRDCEVICALFRIKRSGKKIKIFVQDNSGKRSLFQNLNEWVDKVLVRGDTTDMIDAPESLNKP